MTVGGRFDDHLSGTSLSFEDIDEVVVAWQPGEVLPALRAVERHSAAGRWAFGFVCYEAASAFDASLTTRAPAPGLPLVWFAIAAAPVNGTPAPASGWYGGDDWRPSWDADRHADAVDTVRARIAMGHTYQCNLTTRLHAQVRGDLRAFYAELASTQGAAYSACLDTGRFVVASASPELFFRIEGNRIVLRPMKGTAARDADAQQDARNRAALLTSPKDRAENVMIVDLVRNDVSRIAETGSVAVTRLCEVETYPTVFQLSSEITATVRPDVTLTDVFAALFPSGSITGAPKTRTMALIAELEDEPRGVYCGAIGVVPPAGHPDGPWFSVAIRTAVIDRSDDSAVYGSGGGITWDSRAADEYEELLVKSRVLRSRVPDFHLVETLHHDAAGFRSLEEHLARAAGSASAFGFTFSPEAARQALAVATDGRDGARVRLRAYADGDVQVDVDPLPEPPVGPVGVAVDDRPVDSEVCWFHHKTSRREPYVAALARHSGVDDVLLVNERGELTESCTSNLAVRIDGRWWTPPLGVGCLPGIERGRLVADGTLVERVLYPAELYTCDGIALVNSLRGWRAARLLP